MSHTPRTSITGQSQPTGSGPSFETERGRSFARKRDGQELARHGREVMRENRLLSKAIGEEEASGAKPGGKRRLAVEPETLKHKKAFEVWYECERNVAKCAREIGMSAQTVAIWRDSYNWHERADARDAVVVRAHERESMERKAKLIADQRAAGEILFQRGLRFLADMMERKLPIAGTPEEKLAVQYMKEGLQMRQVAEALPVWVMKIARASDEELKAEYEYLMRAAMTSLNDDEPVIEDADETDIDQPPDGGTSAAPGDPGGDEAAWGLGPGDRESDEEEGAGAQSEAPSLLAGVR